MKKLLILHAMIILIVFIFSCDVEFFGDVCIQDMIESVKKPNEILLTVAKIAFEISGSDDKQRVIDFITRNFRKAKNFRTESKDMSTFIVADI
jgi:hypothetical protein